MENSPLLRISRCAYVPTHPDQYVLAREIHRAKISDIITHTTNPNTYVTGVSAAVLRNVPVYSVPKTVSLHLNGTTRGTRKHGQIYSTNGQYDVRYHRYILPHSAFEIYEGVPTLTIPALLIVLLKETNVTSAIANAESLLRVVLKPDARQRDLYNAKFAVLLKETKDLLTQCNFRAKPRVYRRLELISPWSESIGESVCKVAFLKAGLPLPIQQFEVRLPNQTVRVDFYFPEADLFLEFDGNIKYQSGNAEILIKEKQREDYLRQIAKHFMRLNWQQANSTSAVHNLRFLFPRDTLKVPPRRL